jgi:prepilin-type N-terminal cleavage/methylation domain-containing protein
VKTFSNGTQRRGFTAVELLVVLAVLSLLVAVALPLFLRVRNANRYATCQANLKQINAALLKYAEENSGTLPSSVPRGMLWFQFKDLVKSHVTSEKVFACPSDRGYEEPVPFHKSQKFAFNSYNFNGVNLPGIPNIAGRTVSSIKEPSRTLLSMEWTAHAPLSWHRSRTGSKNVPFYSDAESVVGFVDGHVDTVKIYFDGMNAAFTRDPVSGYAYKYSGD